MKKTREAHKTSLKLLGGGQALQDVDDDFVAVVRPSVLSELGVVSLLAKPDVHRPPHSRQMPRDKDIQPINPLD